MKIRTKCPTWKVQREQHQMVTYWYFWINRLRIRNKIKQVLQKLTVLHHSVSALFLISIVELTYTGNSTKTTAVVIAVPTSTTILILLFLGIWILMKKKKARERHYNKLHFSLVKIWHKVMWYNIIGFIVYKIK